ncbi:hypothetical protein D3C81_1699530 [compost metagenome]
MVNGTGHDTQRVQIRLGKTPGRYAGDSWRTAGRLAITKPLCQPGQYPVNREGEYRPELLSRRVDFAAAVISQVVAGELAVGG